MATRGAEERSIRVIFYDTPSYRAEAEGFGAVEEAEKVQVLEELPLDETKRVLKQLLSIFESLETVSESYCVDEAKTTVGIMRDEYGKLRAGLSAKILDLIGIEVGGKKGRRRTVNELLEITIKRKDKG